MDTSTPIIDVTPISHSSERKHAPSASSPSASFESSGSSPEAAKSGLLARFAQVVLGAGLVAIGIPMLVLPGPGLLSIAVGGFLISRGLRG